MATVLAEVVSMREGRCVVDSPQPLPTCAWELDPMEAPWTRELLIECDGWTAYMNNFVNGGDPTAIAPAVARRLNATCVASEHMPRYGPGHAATQLWLYGPDGEPPLLHIRTLSAHAEDGRWSWDEHGAALPFEDPSSYLARRIQDRLTRDRLVDYLQHLNIRVDDPTFFGPGTVVRQIVDHPTRTESVAEFRNQNW